MSHLLKLWLFFFLTLITNIQTNHLIKLDSSRVRREKRMRNIKEEWKPLTSLYSPLRLALRPSGACSWIVLLLIISTQHSSSSVPSGRIRQYTYIIKHKTHSPNLFEGSSLQFSFDINRKRNSDVIDFSCTEEKEIIQRDLHLGFVKLTLKKISWLVTDSSQVDTVDNLSPCRPL